MALLHNRVSSTALKERMLAETFTRTTISFYSYFFIENPQQFRDNLYTLFSELNVFGRIYIAQEGINAQINVPDHHFEAFKLVVRQVEGLADLRLNIAAEQGKSFWVLKIKVRDKIVADGIHDPSFSIDQRGKYVNAVQMNQLLNDPETVVVDMRNHYEYEVGHFEKAIEIPSDTFRDQLPMAVNMLKDKKEKNIIMYCTGGIRCEKASAYMLHNGFNNVFHLEGGIINYAKQIQEKNIPSKFIGKNFVFDDRLGERITEDIIANCHQCGKPCDTHTNCKNDGCHLLFIQCESCATEFEGCCSVACKNTIHLPMERQEAIRKGIDKGRQVFNKSSARLRPRIEGI
jgi:UPF0176 protein